MSRSFRDKVVLLFLLASSLIQAQFTLEKPIVPAGRWAFVVGVSGYSAEIGPLHYTSKEAKEFSRTLIDGLGFAPENVRLLSDRGQSATLPTSANILASLDALLADKRLDKANLFVFYFSGHGVATPKGDFLLPADVTKERIETMGVPVREVIGRIVGAGLKNVLFIADACRAGTANDFGAELTELCHKSNLAVILGCAPGKRSYEEPSLEQGVFTHFLLEALGKPELRDASGTLWASRLGEEVQKNVHDFTEPQHGKFAQVPTLWGERSTLDVLLAAYPKPPVSDTVVKSFREHAGRLDRKEYAAAMIAYASALYEADRADEAVEMLKTVRSLGELTPEARYTLAGALDTLGRTGESQRVFAEFEAMPPGFWRDLALVSSTSRTLDPDLRVTVASRLFDETGDWTIKLLAYGAVDAVGNPEQKLLLARRLASAGADRRQKLYGQAQLARLGGRWKASIDALEAARATTGRSPSDGVLFLAEFPAIVATGDRTSLDRFLAKSEARPESRGFAEIGRASIAKGNGDVAGRVAHLKAALACDLSPIQLFLAAKVAGPYMGQLLGEFEAAAEKHPYAWRARMVRFFVRQIQGDKTATQENALAADRYMDDPLEFFAALSDFMDGFVTEAVQLGRVKKEVYVTLVDSYFLQMRQWEDRFGNNADLWQQFVSYGMTSERNAQVERIVAGRLRAAPERTPRDLRVVEWLLAMNRGDEVASARFAKLAFEPTERSDPAWFHAAYLASLGRSAEASRLIVGLAPPSDSISKPMRALQTYLLAANGRPTDAKKRLPTAPGDTVADAFDGLTWALLGDWAKAEPLLLSQTKSHFWTFLFVHDFALRRLDARLRSTGRLDAARDLALSAATSQPGNPLFARYSFAAAPSVAAFAGSVDLFARTIDDREEDVAGRLSFSTTAQGAFTGRFVPLRGDILVLKGIVDAWGNVKGSGVRKGRRYDLAGKIAPAALYKKDVRFRDVGQLLQLVDTDASRVVLLARSAPFPLPPAG